MEIVLLILFIAWILGIIAGSIRRRLLLNRLINNHHGKPKYDKVLNLSPAEYELLLFGDVTKAGLVGSLIELHNKGFVKISINDREVEVIRRIPTSGRLNTFERLFIRYYLDQNILRFKLGKFNFWSLPNALKRVTKYSLQERGIIKRSRLKKRLEDIPHRTLWGIVAVIMIPLSLAAFDHYSGGDGESTWFALAAIFTLIGLIVLPLGYGAAYYFKRSYLPQFESLVNVTPGNKDLWPQLRSLYVYFKVSGEDIFTLDLDNLDANTGELLPYYVASRLSSRL